LCGIALDSFARSLFLHFCHGPALTRVNPRSAEG
jgi:hypothetical protein